MFYLFLLFAAAVGGAIYLFLVAGSVPGFKEERLGVLEPLPEKLGQWAVDEHSAEAKSAAARGEKLERRYLFEEGGLLGAGRLTLQVRYRDAATNAILRAEPDQLVKRRRVRTRMS